MANLMEMIENLPIELQEEIYKRKHQLEMKDVCEEILQKPILPDGENIRDCYHFGGVDFRFDLKYRARRKSVFCCSGQRQVHIDYRIYDKIYNSDEDRHDSDDYSDYGSDYGFYYD